MTDDDDERESSELIEHKDILFFLHYFYSVWNRCETDIK